MTEDKASTKKGLLEKQLGEHITRFDKESTKHKRMYRRFRYFVFGLTACSTLLAGLAIALPDLQRSINIAIVFTTAAVGVVTSIEGLRKPSELWIHERTIFASLKDLERELQYRLAEPSDPKSIDDVFERMQDVLGSARDRWSRQIVGQSSTETYGTSANLTQQTRG
jgi:hypothetical protein